MNRETNSIEQGNRLIAELIKHVDGKTDVRAKCWFTEEEIQCEYRYEGMTYGRTLGMVEAVRLGIISCPHDCVQPILGYENAIIGERCECCGKRI